MDFKEETNMFNDSPANLGQSSPLKKSKSFKDQTMKSPKK